MAKQINCGICAINDKTVKMLLDKVFFKCPECGAELWFFDETNKDIHKMLVKECGIRNDQHKKLTNIDNKAHGSFEGNFR